MLNARCVRGQGRELCMLTAWLADELRSCHADRPVSASPADAASRIAGTATHQPKQHLLKPERVPTGVK